MKKIIISTLFVYGMLFLLNSCQQDESLSPVEGRKVVSNSSVVLINTHVAIEIGGIVYENLDARISVKGYDANNSVQWMKEYSFVGPADTLEIRNGFHHYSLELVGKWGINDIQSEIPVDDIWNGRADGPLPVTYTLGGSKKAKKLSMYVISREVNVGEYQPESRVVYSYDNDGRVEYIHYETYNAQTSQFSESMNDTFTNSGTAVTKIIRTLYDKLYSEYQYEYGVSTKIKEINYFTGIITNQITTNHNETDPNDNSVSVNWNFSNGSSFVYEFDVRFKDIASDKTTKYGELCNTGNYTYDKSINPFRHLGYVDMNLQNWSANNKLSEDVDFLACGYPTLIPLFYYYIYDQDGYPVKKFTKYKSGANQNMARHSRMDFFYE